VTEDGTTCTISNAAIWRPCACSCHLLS
jgi:hypothetical protein